MMSLRLLAASLFVIPLLAGAGASTLATTTTVADNAATVSMEFFGFVDQGTLSPVTVIGPGDAVTFVNVDPGTPISAPHTATHGAAAAVDGVVGGDFDTDIVASGDSSTVVFGSPGTFQYYCKLHPWMRGVVVVS